MDLLKYLEPMKNLPDRFSNLAFWRGVRKLRDEVVNAFEYVDSWGTHIEESISPLVSTTDNVQFKSVVLNDIEGFSFRFLRKTDVDGVSEILFTKTTIDLSISKFSTNGIIIVQFTADTSAQGQDTFSVVCPVILYPKNNKCIVFMHQTYNCWIPTTSTTPKNPHITLWYVG